MIKLRTDISASTLRENMKKESDAKVYRRLNGILCLLEGGTRTQARTVSQLSINVFRTWVVRFNTHGIEGLKSLKHTGRPLKISDKIQQLLYEKVISGPSENEMLVRYRLVDLQRFLAEEHQISIAQSGIWNCLHKLNLTWKTGRQRHPKANERAQEDFKKTSKIPLPK